MPHYSRRFFLQTLLLIPVVACSNKTGNSKVNHEDVLSHFNIPLPVENLDSDLKHELKTQAETFYKNNYKNHNFYMSFESLELEQYKNEQFVFLEGMAVSHLMTGFILMARSQ